MRVAGLVQDSIVDGPGLRFAVFVQGCDKDCEGCHNQEAIDPSGGVYLSVSEIIAEMQSNPLTDGLTLTGGEPFLQAGECAELAAFARNKGMNVWTYSGFTFEELLDIAKTNPAVSELLEFSHVLVDGRFVLAQRSLSIKWRGSRNQRVIDLPKSLALGEAVELA